MLHVPIQQKSMQVRMLQRSSVPSLVLDCLVDLLICQKLRDRKSVTLLFNSGGRDAIADYRWQQFLAPIVAQGFVPGT